MAEPTRPEVHRRNTSRVTFEEPVSTTYTFTDLLEKVVPATRVRSISRDTEESASTTSTTLSQQAIPTLPVRRDSRCASEGTAPTVRPGWTPPDLSSRIDSFRQTTESRASVPERYRGTQSRRPSNTTTLVPEPTPLIIAPRPQFCLRIHALLPHIQETVSKRQQMGPIVRATFSDGEKANQYVNQHHISRAFLTGFQEDLDVDAENARGDCQVCRDILDKYGNFGILRKGRPVPLLWPSEIEKKKKASPADYYQSAVESMMRLWETALAEAPAVDDEKLPFDGAEATPGGGMVFGKEGHFMFEIGPKDKRWQASFKRYLIRSENALYVWARESREALRRKTPASGFADKERRRNVVKRVLKAGGKGAVKAWCDRDDVVDEK